MDKESLTLTHSLSLSLSLTHTHTHTQTHLKQAFPLVKKVNTVRVFLPHNATTVESQIHLHITHSP